MKSTNGSTLIIFCRRPTPGIGKQRIAAELGTDAAVKVGELLLAAALEDAREWQGLVVLSPASSADELWATTLLPDACVIPQPEGSLGQRIEAVTRQVRQGNSGRIIIIGTDSPALTSQSLNSAAAHLMNHDTVVIPARDGGITLMGTQLHWPKLAELPWETPQLCKELVDCCRAAGQSVYVMATGSDVDTRQDLIDTYTQLEADLRPARIQLCNWIVRSGLITPDNQPNEDVSIIVPVFNDTDALKELFIRLAAMHPAPAEVVVVDGGADNDCERLCMNYGAVYLRTEPNRGLQLRQGASATSNGILWFLHADSIPPIDAIQVIRRHLQKDYAGGYFRFRFDGPRHWYKRWLEHAINLRVRFGIPYGDQGLFVTRDSYFAAGAHTASPLFEEVKLVQNLRANEGFTEAAAAIDVSSRRWERDGWLRRSLHNRGLAVAFAIGVAPEKLAHHYGSKSRNISKSQDTRNA